MPRLPLLKKYLRQMLAVRASLDLREAGDQRWPRAAEESKDGMRTRAAHYFYWRAEMNEGITETIGT